MNDWITLKELDGEAGLPKGSAFRAFKGALRGLDDPSGRICTEGADEGVRGATAVVFRAPSPQPSPGGRGSTDFECGHTWQESRDYRVLHHEADRAEIDSLRTQGRIYSSTVNLVLLSPAMAAALRPQLRRSTTDPAE